MNKTEQNTIEHDTEKGDQDKTQKKENRTEQNRTEQDIEKGEQNRTELRKRRTEQNRTEQNRTEHLRLDEMRKIEK